MSAVCNVCGSVLGGELYVSDSEQSLTSLCAIVQGKTHVYFCEKCLHIQTAEIENVDDYYASSYELLTESEEEDQVYAINDGKKIFRYDHQMTTLLNLLDFPKDAKVLDYGCAKGATLKKLVEERPDITPYLFDITDNYIPFWDKFAKQDNFSAFTLPDQWNETIDVVTSFFSLEHAVNPRSMLYSVKDLLKDGGVFYCVIPDVLQNVADFIVVDHVNHFTVSSIVELMKSVGMEIVSIDRKSHASAMVVICKKPSEGVLGKFKTEIERDKIIQATNDAAIYWSNIKQKINKFQNSLADGTKLAIYGSGFYGSYIMTALKDNKDVICFLDRDPFKQNKTMFGKKIIDPDSLPDDVYTVMVGLNPKVAKESISMVKAWKNRSLNLFYL